MRKKLLTVALTAVVAVSSIFAAVAAETTVKNPSANEDETEVDTTVKNPSAGTGDAESESTTVKNPSAGTDDEESESTTVTKEEPTTEGKETATTGKIESSVTGDGVPEGATLKVVEIAKDSETYKKVAELVAKFEALKSNPFAVFELDLVKDSVVVQANGTVKVTLAVPENLAGSKSIAVYRLEDNVLKFVDHVNVGDGSFTFTTDHFSTYVFIGLDTVVEDTKDLPDTGDNAAVVPVVVAGVAAAGAMVLVAAKKKKEA